MWYTLMIIGLFVTNFDLSLPIPDNMYIQQYINFIPDCIGYFLFIYALSKLHKQTGIVTILSPKTMAIALFIITIPDFVNFKVYFGNPIDYFDPAFYVVCLIKILALIFTIVFYKKLYDTFMDFEKSYFYERFNRLCKISLVYCVFFEIAKLLYFVISFKYLLVAKLVILGFTIIFVIINLVIFRKIKHLVDNDKYLEYYNDPLNKDKIKF